MIFCGTCGRVRLFDPRAGSCVCHRDYSTNQIFVRQILNSYTEECGFKYDNETEDWVELKERRDLPTRTWEGIGLNGDRFLFSV